MKKFITVLFVLGFCLTAKAQTEEVCPEEATPAGWVIVSYRACAGCCGEFGKITQMPTIKKIEDLPSGTTLEICPQKTPKGWVVTSTRPCAGCCGAAGEITQMPTIKKL
jgi:hypothetical protein